jgi:hypothetical protein
MAQSSMFPIDQLDEVKVTLGSIVVSGDDHGVVWQVTHDMLRVLLIRRGMVGVSLTLATEVALHLPASAVGWSIVHDQLHAWPRALCRVVGEVDERALLKILQARKAPAFSVTPALAATAMAAPFRHVTRFF